MFIVYNSVCYMEEKNAAWWWHQCSFFSVLSKTRRNDKIRILRGFNFVIKSVNLLTESTLESCRRMEFNRNINFYLDHLKHLTSKDILKNAFNDCTLKVWVQRSGILATLLLSGCKSRLLFPLWVSTAVSSTTVRSPYSWLIRPSIR